MNAFLVSISLLLFPLGVSVGMALAGTPVILIATDTPIGSFVLRGNFPVAEPMPPLPAQENQQTAQKNQQTAESDEVV